MKWSILVLTQPSRRYYLTRLLEILRPQVQDLDDVEVVVKYHNTDNTVGYERQLMREECSGEYSNFIDDDDLVPYDYIETIFPLLDGIDFIGHLVQRYDDGKPCDEAFEHSIKYPFASSSEHSTGHINPIKTELALQASMSGGFGEDRRWFGQLQDLGIVRTEHFIPKVMYSYMYRSIKSDGVS